MAVFFRSWRQRSQTGRRSPMAAMATGLLAVLVSGRVLASPPPVAVPITSDVDTDGTRVSTNFIGDLERTNFLLGDMYGLRSKLSRYGITIAIQETSEVLGNVTGGSSKGADYDGLTQAVLQLDTQRAFGWHGGLFNISALQIHGRNLSADNLQSPADRQRHRGGPRDPGSGKCGISRNSWPKTGLTSKSASRASIRNSSSTRTAPISSTRCSVGQWCRPTTCRVAALPTRYPRRGSGSAIGRPTPGRFCWASTRAVRPPANDGDAQQVNASGTQFAVNRGPLVFAEVQYSYPSLGGMMEPGEGAPLGHTYKLGAWFDAENFSDQRYDNTGLSLADPNSTGPAAPALW